MTQSFESKTLIAILNWNGWRDTIACLESLLADLRNGTELLIIDNGSENESIAEIFAFLAALGFSRADWYQDEERCSSFHVERSTVHVLQIRENLGFAKGCNRAAAFAEQQGFEFLLLLNNDTVVRPNAVPLLLGALVAGEGDVVIPRIEYVDPPGVIWNCGGEVNQFGRVRYHFARESTRDLALPSVLRIGFATGCCMLMRVSFFVSVGRFTEQFFFGEEDVEFGLRMKMLNKPMVCVTDALVLHKVGASLQGNPQRESRKAYLHLLNRLVNMKSFMPTAYWHFWAMAVCVRFRWNSSYRFSRTVRQAVKLYLEASRVTGVDAIRFRQILSDGI